MCAKHSMKSKNGLRFTQRTPFFWRNCCNPSGGVALIVWFTTNGMCAKNKNIYAWCEQAIIEWSRRVISIVACCHGAKLCAHATQDFRSQQNKLKIQTYVIQSHLKGTETSVPEFSGILPGFSTNQNFWGAPSPCCDRKTRAASTQSFTLCPPWKNVLDIV